MNNISFNPSEFLNKKKKVPKTITLDAELIEELSKIVQGKEGKKVNLSALTNSCLWQIVNYLKSEEGKKDKNFKIKKEQTKK